MYIAAGRNRLHAAAGAASANVEAQQVRRLFARDAELTNQYNHGLLHGKWDHMMDQTHIGYTFWNQPPANAMPAVQEVQLPEGARLAVFANGASAEIPGQTQALLPFDSVNRRTRVLQLASMGQDPIEYTLRASAPWVTGVDQADGTLRPDGSVLAEVQVGVDWGKAPPGTSEGFIRLTSICASAWHWTRTQPVRWSCGIRTLTKPRSRP